MEVFYKDQYSFEGYQHLQKKKPIGRLEIYHSKGWSFSDGVS
jgi:hypothetical protein